MFGSFDTRIVVDENIFRTKFIKLKIFASIYANIFYVYGNNNTNLISLW